MLTPLWFRTDAKISDAFCWNEQGKLPSVWRNQMHHLFLRLSLIKMRHYLVKPSSPRLHTQQLGARRKRPRPAHHHPPPRTGIASVHPADPPPRRPTRRFWARPSSSRLPSCRSEAPALPRRTGKADLFPRPHACSPSSRPQCSRSRRAGTRRRAGGSKLRECRGGAPASPAGPRRRGALPAVSDIEEDHPNIVKYHGRESPLTTRPRDRDMSATARWVGAPTHLCCPLPVSPLQPWRAPYHACRAAARPPPPPPDGVAGRRNRAEYCPGAGPEADPKPGFGRAPWPGY